MSPNKEQLVKKPNTRSTTEPASVDRLKEPFTISWKWLGIGVVIGMLLFLFLLAIGARPTEVELFGIKFSLPSFETAASGKDPLVGVSLVNMKFMAGGWDPRQVDVARAATEGLWIENGFSLRFYDLWVSVPDELDGYTGQFEAYAGGGLIGASDVLELKPGGTFFETIKVSGYQHPNATNAWQKQSSWNAIDLVLIVYHQGERVGSMVNRIRLDGSGTGWYFAPPYARIVSLIYHVNDGPQKTVDFRKASDLGLSVAPGDCLTIDEIWVKTEENASDQTMRLEAYLSAGEYDSTYSRTSTRVAFERGSRNIASNGSLVWEEVPTDRTMVIITLSRDDEMVLDRLNLPLTTSKDSGLPLETNN